jgi:Fur family ferric uptake transcriptional regulator
MLQARGTRTRSTTQAAAVVAAMSAMPAFRSARDIRDAVRRDGGQVGIATVYRHLRVLTEQGVVDTLRGAGGEVLYRLRHGSLTHHITCRACGHAVEVDGREVWEWAASVAARAGFTLTGRTVELSGLCPAHAGSLTAWAHAAGAHAAPAGVPGLPRRAR